MIDATEIRSLAQHLEERSRRHAEYPLLGLTLLGEYELRRTAQMQSTLACMIEQACAPVRAVETIAGQMALRLIQGGRG